MRRRTSGLPRKIFYLLFDRIPASGCCLAIIIVYALVTSAATAALLLYLKER
jgi:hypothetical protein